MRWSSVPIRAAQALAILLAVVLFCAPFCQPQACTHACCPSHSGDCQTGPDLTASLSASRAIPVTASSTDRLHSALQPASPDPAQTRAIPRTDRSRASLDAPVPLAPTPPLRI